MISTVHRWLVNTLYVFKKNLVMFYVFKGFYIFSAVFIIKALVIMIFVA